jgi:RNA polymerase sigma factor (sigma-70 family)
MSLDPETRPNLIWRLQAGTDAEAWNEFSAIYRPVIIRLATAKGLQAEDSEDLAQKVILSVAKNIKHWKGDGKRAKFRTWLQRVVRNATLNALTRTPKDAAAGGTAAFEMLAELPQSDSDAFDREWRRETLHWAANQVRDEFHPATWDAFWLTAVEGESPEAAAARTGKSIGAVYIARTRVLQRIRAKVAEHLEDES